MRLLFFCRHWGSEHLPFKEFLTNVKDAGYDGVEMSLPLDEAEKDVILTALQRHNLLFIAQHWETVDKNIETHAVNYEKRLRNLAGAKPLFINSQTGKDYFWFEENKSLLNWRTQ